MKRLAAFVLISGVCSVPCVFQDASLTECVDEASCCGFVNETPSAFCCPSNSMCCTGMNVSLCCGSLQICPTNPLQTVCNECPVTGVLIRDSLPHDRDVSVVLGASTGSACGGSGVVAVPTNCVRVTEYTTLEISVADFVHWQVAEVLLQVTSFQDNLVFGPETSAQEGVSAHAAVVGNGVVIRFEGSSEICTLPPELGGFEGPLSLQSNQAGLLLAVADPVSSTRVVDIELTYSCPSGPVKQTQTATYTRRGYDYLRPVAKTMDSASLFGCFTRQACATNVFNQAVNHNLSDVEAQAVACGSESAQPTSAPPTIPPSLSPSPYPSESLTPLPTSSPTSPTFLPDTPAPSVAPDWASPTASPISLPIVPDTVAPTSPTITPTDELPKTRNPTREKKTGQPSKLPTSRLPSIVPSSKPPSVVNTSSKAPSQPPNAEQGGNTPAADEGLGSGVVAALVGGAIVILLIALCAWNRMRNRKQKRKGQPYRNLGYYEPPTINSVSS